MRAAWCLLLLASWLLMVQGSLDPLTPAASKEEARAAFAGIESYLQAADEGRVPVQVHLGPSAAWIFAISCLEPCLIAALPASLAIPGVLPGCPG